MTLYGVNDSWIEPKVAGDRLESVPPCVVRLNALIGHDRPDKIQNPLVAAFRKQRTIARVCNKTQQAEFDQMRMDRDQPERSGFDAAGQRIEIENMVASLFSDVFFAKL